MRAERQGLRVAVAVAGGMLVGLLLDNALPFLAPIFSAQLLLTSQRPPSVRQGVGMVVLIGLMGGLLVACSGLLGDRPWVLLPLLWLGYGVCYWAQLNGLWGAAPRLTLIIGVLVPLLDILQRELGESIVLILIESIVVGLILAWLVHAVWPDTGHPATGETPHPAGSLRPQTTRHALASASILLTVLCLCLTDPRLATAMVIPLTVASLLSQLEVGMSGRTVLGLLFVNLLGGLVASVAVTVVELRPTLWLVFVMVLMVGLLFSSWMTTPMTAKIFAGGLVTFLILFGLGIAPLPNSASELFVTRMTYVLFAIGYTLGMTLLLWPKPPASEITERRAS